MRITRMALRTFGSSGEYLYLDVIEVEDMRRDETSEPRRLPLRLNTARGELDLARLAGPDGTDKKRSER